MNSPLNCYEFFETEPDGTRVRKLASVRAYGFYEAIAQVGDSSKANSEMDYDCFPAA